MDTETAVMPAPARVLRERAFAEFYVREFPRLAAYCERVAGADGDGIAQEALVRVLVRWELVGDPHAYAYRVATNLARRRWRTAARERDAWTLTDAHTSGRASDADGDAALWDAVRRLPAPLRDVVLLHYAADLPTRDIARALRRPEGTVRRRLHEARTRLALALGDDRG